MTTKQKANAPKPPKPVLTEKTEESIRTIELPKLPEITDTPVSLSKLLSTTSIYQPFNMWIVGDTPLITNAWSHSARFAMLQKQVKATKPGKEQRDPQNDFESSLYEMGDGTFGFPVTGVKDCILSSAHKDKGIPRSLVMAALFLNAQMVRTRPALAGAICDMPLVRIYGSKPQMREDMVKIGKGLNKTANLAYRAQFTHWAIRIIGKYNPSAITAEALAFLIKESGQASGIGEWRNTKSGMFGAFHLANEDEERAWDRYAAGKGPLPLPEGYAQAAE